VPRNPQYQPPALRALVLSVLHPTDSHAGAEKPVDHNRVPDWLEGDTCFFENREHRIVEIHWERQVACIRPRNTLRAKNMFWVELSQLKTLPTKLEVLQFPTVFDVVERTGDTLQHWEPGLAAIPTQAEPGSPEKIAILRARLECGQALWHEQDRQCDWQEFQRLASRLGEKDFQES
jgi:hypothetical protein